ncbi:uncharacterized protein LOC106150790 [Lingula anatina]|uniref:Uncharacterized protein LOC106150790 n=1 Tax=Lingula anatina TaxID=7574 RepID=A0A1S3H173_LINAN|nr:uncharacterized protein LOC106150790 [Lingula anatina]|eukprot:XP_013379231.1 uncharacterized protein LOC106150790 [Lingula anatina]
MFLGFVTIAAITASFSAVIRQAEAVCCYPAITNYCGDCSPVWYGCGVGKCDKLMCNCRGGCRSGCSNIRIVGYKPPTCTCDRKRSAGVDYSIDASEVFSNTDTDRNEQLSRDEYIRAAMNLNRNTRSEDIHAEFKEKDKNGDDMISWDEFETKSE